MKHRFLICLPLAACTDLPQDPAEGGFFAGVSGITSGSYDARVDAAEADVDAARARNTELEAQIRRSETELSQLKLRILRQRNAMASADPGTSRRIDQVLRSQPTGDTQSARLASLRQAIGDARALSADLARLSG